MTDRNKQYNFFIFFTDYYVDTKYLKCPTPVGNFLSLKLKNITHPAANFNFKLNRTRHTNFNFS